jgi:Protein of unknown function (DUF3574)
MRMLVRAATLIALATMAGGCSIELLREHPLGCRSDEQSLVRDTLYFGASIAGGGDVDAAAWHGFERDVLTPAFPQGLSVIDAHGTWRGAGGASISETSRIVIIVHADDAQTAAELRKITQRYRDMFRQESVLRERSTVCAQF